MKKELLLMKLLKLKDQGRGGSAAPLLLELVKA